MMSIEKNKTVEIIKDFGANDSDSGSADVQVAILTERIKNLEFISSFKSSGKMDLIKSFLNDRFPF